MSAQRIDQRHCVTLGDQRGKQVLPVMAGGLHHHQRALLLGARRRQGQVCATPCAGSRQQREQLLIAGRVFRKCSGLDHYRFGPVHHRNVMRLRPDIDPRHQHLWSFRRFRSGVSTAVFTPFLVHTRTAPTGAPLDTIRALLNTGRGRQSNLRGPCLQDTAATLSRISSSNLYTLIHC